MKEQKARVIALSLFVADLAINIAGFALLPAELTISLFGNTPLPRSCRWRWVWSCCSSPSGWRRSGTSLSAFRWP